MNRRDFITTGVGLGLASCVARRDATEAVERCLQRINAIDKAGPAINAIIELNPDVLKIADVLDNQHPRSPLHNVPILIKDNIETADAMETTAGSLALVGVKPQRDAFIVERLRNSGLVLLGKTNLSEWANFRSSKSTSGWSARGGLTLNPHKLDHNASGSSSGSAAAVAAGLAPLAVGTETNGSIISPASACGIVGFKPTLGLVSRTGIIPITHWQDTAGPMARSVREAAQLLNVLAGVDPRDAATANAKITDFTAMLKPGSLRGKKLGIVRRLAGDNPKVLEIFETAVKSLRDAGAVIVDTVELPNFVEASKNAWASMIVEFRTELNAYLAARGSPVRSLADLIAFNIEHQDKEMPHFGQEHFEQAERLASPEAVLASQESRAKARQFAGPEGIDAALKTHGLDALICPTNDPIYKIDLEHGDGSGRSCSGPAAIAGYPHLTVPMGFVDDLPVGLSFFGTAWSDALMLSLGHEFERLMPAFRAPKYLPH